MKKTRFVRVLCLAAAAALLLSLTGCSFLEELAGQALEDLTSKLEQQLKTDPSDPSGTQPDPGVTTADGEPATRPTTEAATKASTTTTTKPTQPTQPPVTWKDTYVPSYGKTVTVNKSKPDQTEYWRSTLKTQAERDAYDAIAAGAAAYQTRIEMTSAVSWQQADRIYTLFRNDHPEVFWYNSGYYGTGPESHIDAINLSLSVEAKDIPAKKKQIEAAAKKILDDIPNGTADILAELTVYQRLAAEITYDLDAPHLRDLYGALVEKRCVCVGFADAFRYLCSRLGIRTISITGRATNDAGKTEAHRWNAVMIGGQWYQVDVTFAAGSALGQVKYFNNSEKIRANHTPSQGMSDLPSFHAEAAEYLRYFGLVYQNGDFYDTMMRAIRHFDERWVRTDPTLRVTMRAGSAAAAQAVKGRLQKEGDAYLEQIVRDYNAVFRTDFILWDYEFQDDLLLLRLVAL
ncbi:MAG: hypothetical protein IKI50_01675 [Clostridia bacterium]|nr:hypothetical protein [Clostridia bacterium]